MTTILSVLNFVVVPSLFALGAVGIMAGASVFLGILVVDRKKLKKAWLFLLVPVLLLVGTIVLWAIVNIAAGAFGADVSDTQTLDTGTYSQ